MLQITSLRYSIKEGLHTCKTLAADLQLLSSTTPLGITLPLEFASSALDELDATEPRLPNFVVVCLVPVSYDAHLCYLLLDAERLYCENVL